MVTERQLFVLRHAKSSWDHPQLNDHDRPLAPRGIRATKLLSRYVRTHGIEPARVVCSSARRTRETFDGVAPGGELTITPELYGADAEEILELLRRTPEDAPSVMVIGHNPALQTLVLRLCGANRGDEAGPDLMEVRRKFPTGALATLSFDCGWRDLRPGVARLTDLARPRDLHG